MDSFTINGFITYRVFYLNLSIKFRTRTKGITVEITFTFVMLLDVPHDSSLKGNREVIDLCCLMGGRERLSIIQLNKVILEIYFLCFLLLATHFFSTLLKEEIRE